MASPARSNLPSMTGRRSSRSLPLLLLAAAGCLLGRPSWSFVPGFAGSRAPCAQLSVASLRSRLARASRGGFDETLAAGDAVKALFPDDEQWYPGTIEKQNKDGTYVVKWENPDGGPETSDVSAEGIKKIVIFKDYKVGESVQALFPDDGNMYPATVSKVGKDGTFSVKWEDPAGGPEESEVSAKDMKYPPIPIDKLVVGQKYAGTVRSVLDFGAFVDIGAEGDGLLHISRVSKERVQNMRDYVEEGQEIEVWVSGIRDGGKFGLTMVEGLLEGAGGSRAPKDLKPFEGLSPDEFQAGVVSKIASFGAFVTVTLEGGESADGLVHVSQIRDGFVESVENELSEGQEIRVRVVSMDASTGKMGLSMKEGFGGGGGGAPRASRAPADLSKFQDMASNTWLTGKVVKCAPFGAFVTVTNEDGDSADGLVHITAIKDGFVESVENELSVGQEVQVRVVSVDVSAGKMGLSMKPE